MDIREREKYLCGRQKKKKSLWLTLSGSRQYKSTFYQCFSPSNCIRWFVARGGLYIMLHVYKTIHFGRLGMYREREREIKWGREYIRNEIIFNVFYKSAPLHHPYMRDIRDDWELLKKAHLLLLTFRWRLAINQTVWYGSAAVYFISFFLSFFYTNSLHSPHPHFFFSGKLCVCVHGGERLQRDQLHRSTYSFLKYLTNILMTTCSSPVYCSHPLYTLRKNFCGQPTCLHIVCVYYLLLIIILEDWTRWLRGGCWNSQKNKRILYRENGWARVSL